MGVIEEYIENQPIEKQPMLRELLEVARKSAPEAQERIAWAMPTFTIGKTNIFHFSAAKSHIGIHIGYDCFERFSKRIKEEKYKYSVTTFQLPFDRPVPKKLIGDIVEFNVKAAENKQ